MPDADAIDNEDWKANKENTFIFELPTEFGGSLKTDGQHQGTSGMMAFDIRTGMKDAQNAFNVKEDKEFAKLDIEEQKIEM